MKARGSKLPSCMAASSKPSLSPVLLLLSLLLDEELGFQWNMFMGTLKTSALGYYIRENQNHEGHNLLWVRETGWGGKWSKI